MKDKILAILKKHKVRDEYGCKCHSVEALADEIVKALEHENSISA